MLSKAQEKFIRSLATKKGREKSGLCLVEGKKNLETAGKAVQFTFTAKDTKDFKELVTTETPQDIAGVASIPTFKEEDVLSKKTIVVLDNVQDPGNVGSILRLALGFDASLVLVDSVDVTNPKVIRSSVGALFLVPHIQIGSKEAKDLISSFNRPVYRLEKANKNIQVSKLEKEVVLIAGSEGRGIQLDIKGTSLSINHSKRLESLNVGHALAIVLAQRY